MSVNQNRMKRMFRSCDDRLDVLRRCRPIRGHARHPSRWARPPVSTDVQATEALRSGRAARPDRDPPRALRGRSARNDRRCRREPDRHRGACLSWRSSRAARSLPPHPAAARTSVPGDRRDERRDVFGFLALVEQRRHLAEAARAAFLDRATARAPCAPPSWRCRRRRGRRGSGRCARSPWCPRACGRPHRCERTVRVPSAREAFRRTPPTPTRGLVVLVVRDHERRHHQSRTANRAMTPSIDEAPADRRFGVQRCAGAPRAAADRDEEDRETEQHPDQDEEDDHARGNLPAGAVEGPEPVLLIRPLGATKKRRYPVSQDPDANAPA